MLPFLAGIVVGTVLGVVGVILYVFSKFNEYWG